MTRIYKLILTIAAGLLSSAVLAHVGLAVTVPGHDEVMERAPTQIHFRFMAQVTITNLHLAITEGAGKGKRIDIRLPRNSIGQSTAFGTDIALELPPLAPATYLVTYQAISIDGHILVDDFSFTVSL